MQCRGSWGTRAWAAEACRQTKIQSEKTKYSQAHAGSPVASPPARKPPGDASGTPIWETASSLVLPGTAATWNMAWLLTASSDHQGHIVSCILPTSTQTASTTHLRKPDFEPGFLSQACNLKTGRPRWEGYIVKGEITYPA